MKNIKQNVKIFIGVVIEIFDDELLDIYFEYVRLVLSTNGYPRYGHYEMITKKDIKKFKEMME